MNTANVLHPGSDVREAIRRVAWAVRWPRPRRANRADLRKTADLLAIDLRERALGHLEGLALGRSVIATNYSTEAARRGRFVLAHELGHILIHRGDLTVPEEFHEWAADWFARDLLAPFALLPRRFDERLLAERFGMPTVEVIAQLSAYCGVNDLPTAETWPCPACGNQRVDPGCVNQHPGGIRVTHRIRRERGTGPPAGTDLAGA